MLTIGMTYDLRSDYLALGFKEEETAEFDADITIDSIERIIAERGYQPERIGHAKALCAKLAAGARWDLVFNIAEGRVGRNREAQVPCMLEAFDIPYTMSDPLVCSVTLDKSIAKRILQSEGLATPRFHVVRSMADITTVSLPYPLFAKPIAEGTGKGIDKTSCVKNSGELQTLCEMLLGKYDQPVLVEEFLPGREFTVAILGTGSKARVLGTMEVCLRPNANTSIYTYEMKEQCDHYVDYHKPPRTPETLAVEKLALDSYRVLEVRDCGRVDIRMDRQGAPSFMEVNPLPGLNPAHSDLPIIARQEGVRFEEVIGAILDSALARITGSA